MTYGLSKISQQKFSALGTMLLSNDIILLAVIQHEMAGSLKLLQRISVEK